MMKIIPEPAAKFKVLDLFSGIGGFSLGLERTGGFKTVAFCEIDPFCQNVLKKHWPDVPCENDVTTIEFKEGQADVITGGFPCQDISLANTNGTGLAGERSGLFREIMRGVRVVRPRYVLLENVAELLNRGMGVVCGEMAESGYDTEWDCIAADSVGAVHERERVWIMAYPHDERLQGGKLRMPQNSGEGNIDAALLPSLPLCRNKDELPTPYVVGSNAGIPDRAHRIRALGNTVLPQIPEIIGHAILQAEGLTP